MKKILAVLVITLSFAIFGISSSYAALTLLDDWTLKVGSEYIDNIDYVLYTGLSHVNITDVDGSGTVIPTPGDTFTDVIMFSVSSGGLVNDSTGTVGTYRSGTGIGLSDFELTGVGTMTGVHTGLSGDDVDYVFNTATLDLYLDTTPDATPGKNGGVNSGYLDGMKIGTFTLSFGGGNFDFGDLDGNIDITFKATDILAGYLFDQSGIDFASLSVVAAITDSNSDAFPAFTMPANWTAITGQTVGTDAFDLNLSVDGSARFAVPEPASLLLLGSGLLGLAGLGFRKRK